MFSDGEPLPPRVAQGAIPKTRKTRRGLPRRVRGSGV